MTKKKTKAKPETPFAPVVETPAVVQPVICPFVKFAPEMVHRSKLVYADYNPRTMQEEAKHDLKENIKRVGLIDGPVWNKRTGHVVGGHQRLVILDELMKTQDYMVPVSVVDLDDKTEREQNIFLNNQNSQGDWDLQKLGDMFKGNEVDVVNAGFTAAQMYQMFGDSPMVDQPEQLSILAAQMREARERYNAIKQACGKRDDMDYYLVVFASVEDRTAFLDRIGLPNNRFVDGSALAARVPAIAAVPAA